MNAIMATWTNGQIVPSEPAEWPEGTRLVVRLIQSGGDKTGPDEFNVRKPVEEMEKEGTE